MPSLLLSLGFILAGQGQTTPSETTEKTLKGKITQADGKPAAGAFVWAWKYWPMTGQAIRAETQADANGHYRLALSPGQWFVGSRLGSQGGEGIGPDLSQSLRIFENEPPAPIDIALRERGNLRLKVLAEESDVPIAQARVYLSHGVILTTNQQGEIEIGGLPNGCHSLAVLADGRMTSGIDFCVLEKNTTQLEVPLPRVGKIQGKLTDNKGVPQEEVSVGKPVFMRGFCKFANYAMTGKDGAYALQGFRRKGIETNLWAIWPKAQFYPGGSEDFQTPSEACQVNMILQSKTPPIVRPPAIANGPKRIAGVLVDSNKRPVKGVSISWTNAQKTMSFQTRSNERGEFQMTVTRERGTLAVLALGFVPVVMSTIGPGEEIVSAPLKEGETVKGVLIDDQGQPISGALLAPSLKGPYAPWKVLAWKTDANGRFQLSGWDKTVSCFIVHPDLRSLSIADLKSGGAENQLVFPREGIIKGRVVDAQNQPVRNIAVKLNTPRRAQQNPPFLEPIHMHTALAPMCSISADGGFLLAGLPLETQHTIQAMAAGHGDSTALNVMTLPISEYAAAKPVVVKLAPANALRVKVVQPDLRPIEGARVCLLPLVLTPNHQFLWGQDDLANGDGAMEFTKNDGTAHFPAIGKGQGTLSIRAKGWARQAIPWSRDTPELTIVMHPEAVLEGEIVNGLAWLGKGGSYVVDLRYRDGSGIRTGLMMNDKGTFRLEELPPGKCTLQTEVTYHPLIDENELSIELENGKTHPLKIQWASTPGKDKAGVISR